MNNNSTANAGQGGFKLTPGDIIFTLFRHLRKIVLFLILGVVAGAAVYLLWPTEFESRAKIMIRFVMQDQPMVGVEQNTRVVSPGGRNGGYILDAERAIITSLDLAREVAQAVGPERIINDPEREPSVNGAASKILRSLTVENPRGSNMLFFSLRHEDRETAQAILTTLIDTYQRKHLEIHRKSAAFDDFLTRETDQMRMRLQQTEEELRAERNKANVISIDGAKSALTSEINSLRQSMLTTRAEMAELRNLIDQQEQSLANLAQNQQVSQEEVDESSPNNETYRIVTEYSTLWERLKALRAREQSLFMKYTDANTLVQSVRRQIDEAEGRLNQLRQQYPEIVASAPVQRSDNEQVDASQYASASERLRADKLRLASLQSRLRVLESQHNELRAEARKIDEIEITVNELMRRRALQESKYRALLESVEKARVQDELGDGRVNNISIIQTPSPAGLAQTEKTKIALATGGGIAVIGLAWAFLVDLLLDRTIKRPTEIQRNLHIPLFMSLPDLSDKRFRRIKPGADRSLLLQAGRVKQTSSAERSKSYKPRSTTLQAAALSRPEEYGDKTNGEATAIAPWDEQHALSEHFEALRDKVITFFESRNLTHKPKLIAMTGLGTKSGVTTIASGLASSLSKTGEGNVLLVDMTLGQETAQQFYKGKSIQNLDDVLDGSADAKMEGNLYVVAEGTNGYKLPRIMPQRFNKIMPKLRASDFDYIIFDMPPVSPISSTPRLASFMDIVLMVMESEKTNRDTAHQALEMLSDSRAHLGGILNKTKSHVPKKLEQDLLSQA